ncbi:MAG: hypothetical protein HKM04_06310 [Legionellales bacterium]|nr:hypothetical protein [Legionellales bacterium]
MVHKTSIDTQMSEGNSDIKSRSNSLDRDFSDLAKEGAKIFAHKAQEEVEHLKVNCHDYEKQATNYIVQNPGKSVLAALASGFVLALLLKR